MESELLNLDNKGITNSEKAETLLSQTESHNKNLPINDPESILYRSNVISLSVALIALLVILLISVNECTKCFKTEAEHEHLADDPKSLISYKKKYWAYGRNIEGGYLENVFLILDKLGYKNDPNTTEWDLLWAHDYPFRTLHLQLYNLKPHQKVNKLPGSGYITNKVDLATSGLRYVPKAYRLPKDKKKLLVDANKNPKIEYVQKSNDHRNIFIKKITEINLDGEGTFIQEFIDKPFLISGYKFDIGIYSIITSVDPLRVYIYNQDALLRFCPVKYKPFDSKNVDKYVVGDDYLPTWEIPALKYYYNTLGFSMKESLNAYIRSKGFNPAVVWEQIEDSIRTVTLAKEQDIINIVNKFSSKRNFFEMMRFDFVLTENLIVYLMEANMSPNLSSAHFPPNKLLFEQVIFNLFGLVGIGNQIGRNTVGTATGTESEEQMHVADKNVMVFPTECNSLMCRSSCVSPICQLCRPCLSKETKTTLMDAYLEHVNKGTTKRIFPPPLQQDKIDLNEDLEEYSAENQLIYRWFQGKCLIDPSWCT